MQDSNSQDRFIYEIMILNIGVKKKTEQIRSKSFETIL